MINIALFNTLENPLDRVFNNTYTENGDNCFKSTGNLLLDILFNTEYFTKEVSQCYIGEADGFVKYKENYIGNKFRDLSAKINTVKEDDNFNETFLVFAMFIRDPRYGLGRRDLGRYLLWLVNASESDIVVCGRYDDLYKGAICNLKYAIAAYWEEVRENNALAKKWAPRFNTANDAFAKYFCKVIDITEKEYRKAIKGDTVEKLLSCHEDSLINFEHVPSLAMIKYYNRFQKDPRFAEYLEGVKKGDKKLNVATTTVYDIYKNREKIDADLFFDKLEKIKINCIPILDTSGSMYDGVDSIGKAMSIAYYLAKCSTYCNNHVVSFSSCPQLIKIHEKVPTTNRYGENFGTNSKFCRELNSMYTGDCSNTDFGAVIELLSKLDEFPEYFVVLSDMQFDYGSNKSKNWVMEMFAERGIKTKIVWWNFNSREMSTPETDSYGNIFMSGYSPMLLKYLEAGFNGQEFLGKLLNEYSKAVGYTL